ncbi:MAG: DUF4288 domain-containing protein [Actinomycetota bacterium]|nr:DUF4288 domain-containing protein [Actinomycetota bacterium]
MAPAHTGPRFFTVKVWNDWARRFGPLDHVELCMFMVRAADANEARLRAFEHAGDTEGLETSDCEGAAVQVVRRGVDAAWDTGRSSLDDFVDDPLVYSELHEVDEDGGIDYFDHRRPTCPQVGDLGPPDVGDLPDEPEPVVGDDERWFGVKFWRTWSVGDDDPQFLEEIVLVVRATSPDEAGRRATELAVAADAEVVNDRGELVHVRTVNRDYVFDTHSDTLITLDDWEVFGQLFELNPDGSVEFFDPDNDLPFREGAIAWS